MITIVRSGAALALALALTTAQGGLALAHGSADGASDGTSLDDDEGKAPEKAKKEKKAKQAKQAKPKKEPKAKKPAPPPEDEGDDGEGEEEY